ncbi:hypothetical protein BX666DRAFT_1943053 [Dichotomocladium elegans]|nr:hypothetical protein BX666DRAFT_1943053 [Dichotomocladium elegans]
MLSYPWKQLAFFRVATTCARSFWLSACLASKTCPMLQRAASSLATADIASISSDREASNSLLRMSRSSINLALSF